MNEPATSRHLSEIHWQQQQQLRWLTCGAGHLLAGALTVDGVSRQLAHVLLVDAHQDVFRLDVRVNDLTLGV